MNDYVEIGISAENIPQNSFSHGNARLNASKLWTLFATADYYLNDILVARPLILVKSDGAQTQTDIGALMYYDQFFGGLTLRGLNSNSLDAMNSIVGLKINDHLRVSYSFDIGLSALRTFHDGTHEFIINYNLNKKLQQVSCLRLYTILDSTKLDYFCHFFKISW